MAHRRNGANREGSRPQARGSDMGGSVRRAAFDVAFAEFVWWLKVTLCTCSSRGHGVGTGMLGCAAATGAPSQWHGSAGHSELLVSRAP